MQLYKTVDRHNLIRVEDNEGFGSFLEKNGFSGISSVPMLSVELKSLLSKPVVKRTILSEEEGVRYVPLAELNPEQLEELFNSFTNMRPIFGVQDVPEKGDRSRKKMICHSI